MAPNSYEERDRINGAQQHVIRQAISDLHTLAPDLYDRISADPKFQQLSSSHREDPARQEAVLWFLRELSKLQMSVDRATSTTLEEMQKRINESESGRSGTLSSALQRMFRGKG